MPDGMAWHAPARHACGRRRAAQAVGRVSHVFSGLASSADASAVSVKLSAPPKTLASTVCPLLASIGRYRLAGCAGEAIASRTFFGGVASAMRVPGADEVPTFNVRVRLTQ